MYYCLEYINVEVGIVNSSYYYSNITNLRVTCSKKLWYNHAFDVFETYFDDTECFPCPIFFIICPICKVVWLLTPLHWYI